MINRKGSHPILDYPAGLAYHLMGFDIPAFTPIFVMSRITGSAAASSTATGLAGVWLATWRPDRWALARPAPRS